MFLTIDLPSLSVEEAKDQLKQLVDRLQQLNRVAEIPSSRAWKRAKKSIETGSQDYEADKT
jgi:hypothetical protein